MQPVWPDWRHCRSSRSWRSKLAANMAQSTTGRRTRVVDLFPPAPADHPIFKRGFVIGTTRSADFSTSGAPPPAAPKPSAKPTELSQEPSNQEPPEEPMPDEQLEKLAEEAKAFLERKRRQQRSSNRFEGIEGMPLFRPYTARARPMG